MLDATGYGKWSLVSAGTVRTDAKLPLDVRLLAIAQAVREVVAGWTVTAAVVECAADQPIYNRGGARTGDARAIAKLMLSTGAVVGALRLPPSGLLLVSPSRWWPRNGRNKWSEAQLVKHARARTPALARESEHAVTAVSLGDWWTRNDGLIVLSRPAA